VPGARQRLVLLGQVLGAYGVRGWVRVRSDTEPPEGILRYRPWLLGGGERWQEVEVLEGARHRHGVIARLAGCEDREAARALGGTEIAVRREQLPPLPAGEVYWTDLIGLRVVNREGCELGTVERVMATGANDVLVVRGERERLVPYVPGRYVLAVDVTGGRLEVDWAPED